MKASAQPIAKINSVISDDGRATRFIVVVRTGQSLAFTVPFNQIGLLIRTIQDAARSMRDRLFGGQDPVAEKLVPEALAGAATVSAVALGRDTETGETLLWIETTECGAYSLRLSNEALSTLKGALLDHDRATNAVEVDRRGLRRTG